MTSNLLARIEMTGCTYAADEALEKACLLKRIKVNDRIAGSPCHYLTASRKRAIGVSIKSAIEAAPVDGTKALAKRVLKIQ